MTFTVNNIYTDTYSNPTGLLVQFGALTGCPFMDSFPTTTPSASHYIAPPTYHSTGLYRLSSDTSRDATWRVISVPAGSAFTAGENAFVVDAHPEWFPASASSGWIGVTAYGNDWSPLPGNYQYQTTFSLPSASCTSLEVNFSSDDGLVSVVVSDGTSSTTITSVTGGNRHDTLSTFTATGLGAITTMTFTVNNIYAETYSNPTGLLVQFGALTGC